MAFRPSMIGRGPVAAVLVQAGADPKQALKDGKTALSFAAQQRAPDMAALLLASGAAVDQADNEGATPLLIASQPGRFPSGCCLLHCWLALSRRGCLPGPFYCQFSHGCRHGDE